MASTDRPAGAPDVDDAADRARPVLLLVFGSAAALVMGLYLWPLLPALVVSAVAATLVGPLQHRAEARFGRPGLVAFVTTVGVFLLVLLPFTGVAVLIGREAAAGIEWLEREAPALLGAAGGRLGVLEELAGRFGLDPAELSGLLASQLEQVGTILATRSVAFVSGIGGWLLQGGVALFTLYYLLRDSRAVLAAVRWLSPLEPDQTLHLVERARDVTYATVFGNLLVAVVQGLLGGLAFWALGLPSAALWGTIMGILSLIPVVGPPLVWVPGVIHLVAIGEYGRGLVLLIFGTLVISTVDNVLRTWLVSGRTRVHPLVVFLGVVGGIFLFGAAGVVVGPVVFVLALALLQMARVALDPEGAGPSPSGGFLLPLGEADDGATGAGATTGRARDGAAAEEPLTSGEPRGRPAAP